MEALTTIPPIAIDVSTRGPSVSYVCMSSVTLVHRSKADERNEMPFDPTLSNTILGQGFRFPREREI